MRAIGRSVHAALQHSQLVIWGAINAVEPVVENDDPLVVVITAFVRIINDHGRVEAAVQLRAHMWVEEVRARVGYRKLV